MPSISQEDSDNRGKKIGNFNEKCTCIHYKCVEYIFLNQRTLYSCVQFSDYIYIFLTGLLPTTKLIN